MHTHTLTNCSLCHVMLTIGSRGRRKSNDRRRRRPAVTSHVYRMCGHLDSPFAFVTRARNVTVGFHSDHAHEASGFSIGYVTYSGRPTVNFFATYNHWAIQASLAETRVNFDVQYSLNTLVLFCDCFLDFSRNALYKCTILTYFFLIPFTAAVAE